VYRQISEKLSVRLREIFEWLHCAFSIKLQTIILFIFLFAPQNYFSTRERRKGRWLGLPLLAT